jgi:hypothetical protein
LCIPPCGLQLCKTRSNVTFFTNRRTGEVAITVAKPILLLSFLSAENENIVTARFLKPIQKLPFSTFAGSSISAKIVVKPIQKLPFFTPMHPEASLHCVVKPIQKLPFYTLRLWRQRTILRCKTHSKVTLLHPLNYILA